LLKGVKK